MKILINLMRPYHPHTARQQAINPHHPSFLLARFKAGLDRRGFHARLAMADTPGAAWAVARFGAGGPGSVVPAGGARDALLDLPVAALRLDAAGSGLRFTTIDPGMVETDFSKVRFGGDEEKAKAVYDGMDPIRPEDVADLMVFALSERAGYMTGATINIDGGTDF